MRTIILLALYAGASSVLGCTGSAAPSAPTSDAATAADFAVQDHALQHDRSAVAFGLNTARMIEVQPSTVGSGRARKTYLNYARSVPIVGSPGSYTTVDSFDNLLIPNEDFVTSPSGAWELHADVPQRGRIDLVWTNPHKWLSYTPRTTVIGSMTVRFVGQSIHQDVVAVTGTVFGEDIGSGTPVPSNPLAYGFLFLEHAVTVFVTHP